MCILGKGETSKSKPQSVTIKLSESKLRGVDGEATAEALHSCGDGHRRDVSLCVRPAV
jgi:hypothetical protein